jgi:thiol-disulfide isomerase/thioredoxin
MRTLTNGCGFLVLVLAATGCSPSSGDGAVELRPIPLSDLDATIAGFKGKVVVVDFWADWCGPCKRAFPHLVMLHHKLGKDGLAAVSVNLDEPAKQDVALQFLKEKNATFTNLAIAKNESPKQWFTKLQLNGIPCVFVYNQEGTLVERFVGGDKYPAVEELVEDLLAKKK